MKLMTMTLSLGLSALALLQPATVLGVDDFPWQPSGQRPKPKEKEKDTLSKIPEKCSAALSDPAYVNLAQLLPGIIRNPKIADQLRSYGLVVTETSWNDTGRDAMSSGGANISDVKLAAITRDRAGAFKPIPQPIVRLNNFEDKTVDIDLDKVFIPVGNAWGVKPFQVSLRSFIEYLPLFLSKPEMISGSLLAPRDSQLLVSAQASIMPVPKNGRADFVPSIYNYQSTAEHPALLVIMVTNLGTSVTVIDNTRDPLSSGGWGGGQMLFHNKNGQKSPLTLESLKDVSSTKAGRKRVEDLTKSGQEIAGVSGVNQVMMISIPLVYPERPRRFLGGAASLESAAATGVRRRSFSAGARGLDTGVVGVAEYSVGPFVELDGKGPQLQRDGKRPIRIDVVRYMATDTADLTVEELRTLPEELRRIYAAGENLGSLVTGDDYTRVTRNYEPWRQKWWKVIVVPYLPPVYRINYAEYFEEKFGPAWIYRFATEELARSTMKGLQ